jgi:hypothetical protein
MPSSLSEQHPAGLTEAKAVHHAMAPLLVRTKKATLGWPFFIAL